LPSPWVIDDNKRHVLKGRNTQFKNRWALHRKICPANRRVTSRLCYRALTGLQSCVPPCTQGCALGYHIAAFQACRVMRRCVWLIINSADGREFCRDRPRRRRGAGRGFMYGIHWKYRD
jgi:hypothetical protein